MRTHEIEASADEHTGALIFRSRCECGLRSGWKATPEQAHADRPATCRAHGDTTPRSTT